MRTRSKLGAVVVDMSGDAMAMDLIASFAINDNAPHDPRDYEEFDPASLPADMFYADDEPMDVCAFMALADCA